LYDFDSLMEEIIRNKPDLTREEIMTMIQEKKENVGSGFLTDQGALFLIAGELGVQLKHMISTDLTLKDLYVGANDITIVARVLSVYPISEYNKKEGGTGRYRRLVLFDRDSQSKLTVWDDNPEAIKLEGISVDTPVRVLNGYVRQGLDGKPNLNLGRKGRIELLTDETLVSRLTQLSKLSKKVGQIGDESQNLVAVEGLSTTDSRTSTFTRKDGSSGSLTQFELKGESDKDKIRIVVWDASGLEVKSGQAVLVTNLRVKKSLNGENELHGDKGSAVTVSGTSKDGGNTAAKVSQVKEHRRRYDLEVMALSQPTVSDVQLKDGGSARKGEMVVGDDTGEIALTAWRELAERLEEVNVGDKIRVSGVTAQSSRMGGMVLQLEEGSKIEKVSA
jgi:hypothetical protein